jgi:hypothetical protein
VLCHHAGTANYSREWGLAIRAFEAVEIATDWDDPATREDGINHGEELARKYRKDCPHATRVRPPAGKDWCSS